MKKGQVTVFIIFLTLLGSYSLSTCRSSKKVVIKDHYIDSNDTRIVQVEKCGSCHKDVYENWKMDGHSNAYLSLENFYEHVEVSKHFPEGYSGYLKESNEMICITCHTGQNLFETNFKGVNHKLSPHSIVRDSMPKVFEQALGREVNNRNELLTGVDCLTCHVQGDQVVSNFNSTYGEENGVIKSRFFSSNQNCYSCHHHQVSTMNDLIVKKQIPYEISCINCHQEYDSENKGTHYFYWRNDHDSKKRPDRLNIFDCVNINILKGSNRTEMIFEWTNKIMPHGFSECGEAKCVVIAFYKGGNSKVLVQQYLNRKKFFDQFEVASHFRIGVSGDQFEFNKPIVQKVEVFNYQRIDSILVQGWVKPQYWSTEDEFILKHSKKLILP